jgi:WD40 repeat protein
MLKKYLSLAVFFAFTSIAEGQIGNLVVPTGHTVGINKTIISPDKRYAYTVSEDLVTMWDIRRQLQMYSIRHGLQYKTTIVKLSPDGNYLAVADLSRLAVYSTINGKQVAGKMGRGTYSLMFSADSKTIYFTGDMDSEYGKRYPLSGIVAKNLLTGNETTIVGCSQDPSEKTCPFSTFNFRPISDKKVYLPNLAKKGWDILDLVTKEVSLVKPQSFRTLSKFKDSVDKSFWPIPNTKLLQSVENENGKFYPILSFYDANTGKILAKIELEFSVYETFDGCDGSSFVIKYNDEEIAPKQYRFSDLENGLVKPKPLKKGAPIYAECNMQNKYSVLETGVSIYNDSTQILHMLSKDSIKKEIDMSRMVSVAHKLQQPGKGVDAKVKAISRNGKWILRYESFLDAKGNGLDRYQLYNTKNNTSQKVNATFLTHLVDVSCYFSNDENQLFAFIRDFENSGTLYKIDLKTMASRQVKAYKNLKAVNETQQYAVALVGNAPEIFDINSGRSVTAKFSLANDYTFMWDQKNIETYRQGDTVFIKNDIILIGISWQNGSKLADSDAGFDYNGLKKIFPSRTVVDSASWVHSKRLIDGRPGMFFSADRKLVYTMGPDNSIGVFDAETGHFYGQMYLFEGSNDWVFIDPEGRFDGTPGGMKQLYYLKDRNFIPLDLVFEKYYTPNLYQRLLAGEKFPPIPEINIKPKPSSKILYAEKQRNLEVEDDKPTYVNTTGVAEITVQATAPEDKVDEIRLFHNGKVITLATRGMFVTDNDGSDSKKYMVNLLPGVNNFRAISLNSQRTESDADEITVSYAANGGQPPPTPNKNNTPGIVPIDPVDKTATMYLMVVGINAYKDKISPLTYALPDATAFKDEIEKDAKSMLANVKTYFISDAKADKAGIINAFTEIKQNAKPQDVFVFYYAGHGYIHPVTKEFYLVSANVADGGESLLKNGVPAKELQQYAVEIQAQKQLFVLDACQSAGAFEKMLQHDGEQQKALAVVSRSTGTHWMAASGSTETAKEFAQLGHGAFTYVLLQALKGQAAANKMITVNGLKNFLLVQVPELVKKYGGNSQYPASYGFGNDFPVEVLK